MLDILEYVLENYMGEKLNHPDVLANVVLEEVEKYMTAYPSYPCYDCGSGIEDGWESEDDI